MSPADVVASSSMSVFEAAELMDRLRHHGLAVVDHGELVGVVSITDVLRIDTDRETTPVTAVMTSRPITVHAGTPVSEAMERMAVLDVGRLPVVAEDRRLIGMFRRVDAIRAYHHALAETTGGHLERDRLRQRIDPDASYYDFRVPPGSIADGRAVRDVRWPAGSTLVSVRRGTDVMVPDGATMLRAGDVVTAFGTGESKQRMIDRMNTGAEEPTAEIEIGPIRDLGESPNQG
jgi:predicted transcriptional regulator